MVERIANRWLCRCCLCWWRRRRRRHHRRRRRCRRPWQRPRASHPNGAGVRKHRRPATGRRRQRWRHNCCRHLCGLVQLATTQQSLARPARSAQNVQGLAAAARPNHVVLCWFRRFTIQWDQTPFSANWIGAKRTTYASSPTCRRAFGGRACPQSACRDARKCRASACTQSTECPARIRRFCPAACPTQRRSRCRPAHASKTKRRSPSFELRSNTCVERVRHGYWLTWKCVVPTKPITPDRL